jgi:TolB-like protein
MTPPDPNPQVRRGPSALSRWIAELKRRKVPRVVATYGAVSLLVMEVADLVFPRIPLPDWTVTLVVWLAILGMPVAAVLAWALELTPGGVQRTAPAEEEEITAILQGPRGRLWAAGLTTGVGVLLLGLGFWLGTRTVDGGAEGPDPAREGGRPAGAYVDPSVDERPAIAVLPFADVSETGDQQYFSDGVSEEILNVLSRIRDLRVAARSSAFSYRSDEVDSREAGVALGVPYVLSGSVRRFGDAVRISVELVGVQDGFRLWGETYERTLDDIFRIQTEIAGQVARELRVPLGLPPEQLADATLDTHREGLHLGAGVGGAGGGPGHLAALRRARGRIPGLGLLGGAPGGGGACRPPGPGARPGECLGEGGAGIGAPRPVGVGGRRAGAPQGPGGGSRQR